MSKNTFVQVTQNIEEITPATKFLEILLKDEISLNIDIQALMREPIHSTNAWVNVTPILKAYDKRINNWLRNENVKEFINLVNDDFFNSHKLSNIKNGQKNTIKPPFPKSQWYNKSKYAWLNQDCPLICARRGKYNSGTYLHQDLFLDFIMTIDPKIKWEAMKLLKAVISQADVVKVNRVDTKTAFHPLAKTIKDLYIPARSSEMGKKMAYANLMDLANIKVLGCTASVYRREHGIDSNVPIRDTLTKEQLEAITKVEEHINGLIYYAKITDYKKLKQEILGVEI